MDQGKGHAEAVGNGGGAFGTACVRADNDCVAVVGDVLLDVALQERVGVEVVDWLEDGLVRGGKRQVPTNG